MIVKHGQILNKTKPAAIILLSCFLFLLPFNGEARKKDKEKKRKAKYELEVEVGGNYDDNILRYSEKYLDRFLNREDEGRFHIDTYDDFILTTALGIEGTYYLFGKNKTRINADFKRRTYMVNPIKDWTYFTAGIRQYLPSRISFKFLYSYIPDFYVRHFRDEVWVDVYGYESNTFTPYVFSKDNFGFYIQKYFYQSSRIKLKFYYAQYFHNQHYTEYDSDNLYYGIDVYQPINDDLRIEAGFEFVTSDAKGYDAAYETPETTDGPDATYVEDRFNIGLRWQPPRIKKHYHEVYFRGSFNKRYYTTDHPVDVDPLHAGRVDEMYGFSVNYRYKVSRSFDVEAFYEWNMRDTETTSEYNSEFVSNEKDYKQNSVGMTVTYNIDF